jgi:hypothetical protein
MLVFGRGDADEVRDRGFQAVASPAVHRKDVDRTQDRRRPTRPIRDRLGGGAVVCVPATGSGAGARRRRRWR